MVEKINIKKYISFFRDIFFNIKDKFFVIDPYKNWMTMVSIFILIVIYISISKFFLFYQITSDDYSFISRGLEEISVDTIDRSALDEVLTLFKLKEDRFNNLLSNPPEVIEL